MLFQEFLSKQKTEPKQARVLSKPLRRASQWLWLHVFLWLPQVLNSLNKTLEEKFFIHFLRKSFDPIKEIQFYEVLCHAGQARGCFLACPCLCLL